jgi:hypothetical protein
MHGYWLVAVAMLIGSLELIALTVEWHARKAWESRRAMVRAAPTSH